MTRRPSLQDMRRSSDAWDVPVRHIALLEGDCMVSPTMTAPTPGTPGKYPFFEARRSLERRLQDLPELKSFVQNFEISWQRRDLERQVALRYLGSISGKMRSW